MQPAPEGHANPWNTGQSYAPQPTDQGVWSTPYGYQAYPYGYYNGYMVNPYPVAPSPWAVPPTPAYPAR